MQEKERRPTKAEMKLANVHPETGLATDYLNLFNEYIMLAEMVESGSMEQDALEDWQAVNYESHFIKTGFKGVKTVLSSYRTLDIKTREQFDDAVNELIALILEHKKTLNMQLCNIKHQRDIVASLVSGSAPVLSDEIDHTQADIDALFD